MKKGSFERIPITVSGHRRLEEELYRLKRVERGKVILEIEKARGYGDLSENAEYAAAKERQAFIEGRIAELTEKLSRCDIMDPSRLKSERVIFGCTVKVKDLNTGEILMYQIVGVDEVSLEDGRIPYTSPIARGLIGRTAGEVIEVTTPRGSRVFEILELLFI